MGFVFFFSRSEKQLVLKDGWLARFKNINNRPYTSSTPSFFTFQKKKRESVTHHPCY